jgi:hypothetical protein
MTERLLSHDPITGLTEWHSYDELTDTTIIRTEGDSEPYLDMNKKMANDTDFTKKGIKDEFWLYASIPPAVQVQWLIEKGVDVYNKHHGKEISKLLEHPDYRYLKTTTKHHRFK